MATTLHLIGGNGGDSFSFTGETNGASLQRMWVWVGGSQVKAVRVWLTDGRNQTFGRPEGNYNEFVFQLGERITSLSMWGNGIGTRLGGIKFKTNLNRDFFVKMTSWSLKTEYPIDVGSGFCLGLVGRSGWDIDCMGFLFVRNVQAVRLVNVCYPTINQEIPNVALEEIKALSFRNESSCSQSQSIQTTKTIRKTSSWSVSDNISATFSVEVKAGIPGIAEMSTGFSTTVGTENTYSRENTNEKTETLSTNIEVPPKKKVDVKIIIGRCTFDLPYTATVLMMCSNGAFAFPIKGNYKGVTYTDIKVDTKESNL